MTRECSVKLLENKESIQGLQALVSFCVNCLSVIIFSTKIQQDSKELLLALKRNMKNLSSSGTDMFIKRNQDLVKRHLQAMDTYIN